MKNLMLKRSVLGCPNSYMIISTKPVNLVVTMANFASGSRVQDLSFKENRPTLPVKEIDPGSTGTRRDGRKVTFTGNSTEG